MYYFLIVYIVVKVFWRTRLKNVIVFDSVIANRFKKKKNYIVASFKFWRMNLGHFETKRLL